MPDFSNSANWTLIHDVNYIANVESGNSSYPFIIGEKLITVAAPCKYFVIKTAWSTVNTSWVYAGTLGRKIIANIPDEEPQEIYLRGSIKVNLNDTTFIQYDDYNGDITLSLTPYDWIQHLDVKIWQYTGIEVMSGNVDLTPITDALTTLQTSVDTINELLGG